MKDIAIGIKTFLRDPHLFNCIDGICASLPDAQMLIVDSGRDNEIKSAIYSDLKNAGHDVWRLNFDIGFGAASNFMVSQLNRKYILISSDDFNFRPLEVREGIERLQEVLDYFPEAHIASGRVNNNPYEFDWSESENGTVLEEIPIDRSTYNLYQPWFTECDLTVNYSLIRREVFDKVRWDEDAKIGQGEHASFFLDCRRAGFKTVWVPGVNIQELQIRNPPEYNRYRSRANSPERPCFKKRGIKRYVLANGIVDYEEKSK
jgi:GT2 family glycosyltransferase